jgi:hypothetical protein
MASVATHRAEGTPDSKIRRAVATADRFSAALRLPI